MRNYCLFIYLLMIGILHVNAQTSFMTFNLRYNNPGDKENCWEYRKSEVADMLNRYHPDILGIQEGLHDQVVYLYSALLNYDYAGVGRDDGKTKGEYSAIFYNTGKFKLLSTKTYWLSNTPEKVSIGWDAALERIVTYAELVNKTSNDTIYVFNCHLDHVGKIARERSAALILTFITQMNLWTKKVVVMGDMNSEPMEPPAQLFISQMDYAWSKNGVLNDGPAGTFNAFNTVDPVTKRIDYIFTKNISFSHYYHIADRRKNNLWLSDHLPVMGW
jgi:endonuclease/exonuclease/phosphatase family metal-dependent hydrolase